MNRKRSLSSRCLLSVALLLQVLVEWANHSSDVLAIALTGSWARREERPDSDIDIAMIVHSLRDLRDAEWLKEIRWQAIGLEVDCWHDKDDDSTWSRFVTLTGGDSIEFAFESVQLINPNQIETLAPFCKGIRPLLDKKSFLQRVWDACCTHGCRAETDTSLGHEPGPNH